MFFQGEFLEKKSPVSLQSDSLALINGSGKESLRWGHIPGFFFQYMKKIGVDPAIGKPCPLPQKSAEFFERARVPLNSCSRIRPQAKRGQADGLGFRLRPEMRVHHADDPSGQGLSGAVFQGSLFGS